MLNSYLTDADVEIVAIASHCLKAMLCTSSGNTALNTLSEYAKELLAPYRPTKKGTPVRNREREREKERTNI